MWYPFVTRNGLLFVNTDDWKHELQKMFPQVNGQALNSLDTYFEENKSRLYLYPETEKEPVVYNYPALPIALSNKEINQLKKSSSAGLCGGTAYGSLTQSKQANEDFALVSRLSSNEVLALVADGVSTKNFWPERASRVSVLATFKALGRQTLKVDENTDVAQHGQLIKKAILESLQKDRANLLAGGFVPLGTTREFFDRKKSDPFWWYQTTLNFIQINRKRGYIFNIGDGGIWAKIEQGDKTKERSLIAPGGAKLTSFISLDENTAVEYITDLGNLQNYSKTTFFLSTDGVDDTLVNNGVSYFDLDISGQESIDEILEELSNDNQPSQNKRVIDNYSLVKVQWPTDKPQSKPFENVFAMFKSSDQARPPGQLISLSRMRHEITQKMNKSLIFTNFYASMAVSATKKVVSGIALLTSMTAGKEQNYRGLSAQFKKDEFDEDFMTDSVREREQQLANKLDHYLKNRP